MFVDADRSAKFESAVEYARRELSADDRRTLVARLGAYDVAVAIQAASLLRAENSDGFEERIRSMIQAAPANVAEGLLTYLRAWKERITNRESLILGSLGSLESLESLRQLLRRNATISATSCALSPSCAALIISDPGRRRRVATRSPGMIWVTPPMLRIIRGSPSLSSTP